jgi:benzoate transport
MSLAEVQQQIATRPLQPLQVLVVALGVLINMVDGIDLLAAALVSPIIQREWGLSPEMLGLLMGSSLLGTATGALLLSPIADLLGRRSAIMVNLAFMTVGMFVSAMADSVMELTVLRFLTGMGVGAMASCVGTLVFEYCSHRTRNLGLGLVTIGYNVGVVIGGILSMWIIEVWGWRSIFVFGGLCSALLIPLVYFLLPESIDFMVARPRPGTLQRLNRVMDGLRLPRFTQLPEAPPRLARSSPLDLLRQPMLPRLALMMLAYFLYMLSSYYFMNWNNQLTTEAGFTDVQGRLVTTLTNVGGIAGGVVIGLLTLKLPLRPVATVTLVGMGLAVIGFGAAPDSLLLTLGTSVLAGFGIFGGAVALYAAGAATFPARVRATGMGLSMTAGRFGAFLGPLAGGFLLGAGSGRLWTCVVLALPVMLSVLAMLRVPLTPLPDED